MGVRVEVIAIAPHPLGGWKATEVRLASDAATYDTLLAARDESLGLRTKQRLSSAEEAAAASAVLAWVVVLLDAPPPTGPAAFIEWSKRLGLQAAGIRARSDGEFRLGFGRHDALAYVGDAPFPRERLTNMGAPAEFHPGGGFVSLSLGLPGKVALLRATGVDVDPWAVDGPLRDLSRMVYELSRHGPAVLLPQAGTLLSSEQFRERLGQLVDDRARPFRAWICFAFNPEAATYSSYGMGLQALPDVTVDADTNDSWELDRAREALLVACSRMVHANEPLKPGERLEVRIGQNVGAEPIAPEEGDVEAYVVEATTPDQGAVLATEMSTGISRASGCLHLRRVDPAGARARWAIPSEGRAPRVGLNTYQELLLGSLAATLTARRVGGLSPRFNDQVPLFEVDVWEAEQGFFMSTNGIGLVPQLYGQAEDCTDHVELVAAMEADHPRIAETLALVAAHVHLQRSPGERFKPGDTIGIALPEVGAAGFVLRDAGSVTIAKGPLVHLLELVPATQNEYAEARERGSAGLLAKVGPMSPQSRAARWRVA